ncbi:MAG: hypothetical protein M1818_002473 [Claussenomyces sp. TS43310]|nr:MAG: hypothetical protein M1818_002473 [Claussenomyces sp. TS43310]
MKYAAILAALAGFTTALPATTGAKALKRAATIGDAMHPRHHTLPLQRNTTNAEYDSNWAGAVQNGNGWTTVQGTITVPQTSGSDGSAASAWVGIDGDSCQSAILQTGVSFYADGTFDAWYEWIPDGSYSFDNFDLSVGDQIAMSVDASSTTSGTATLENLTSGQKVTHSFSNPPSTLCETNAEWIVEDFEENGSLVPLANFGTVTFTDASATGSDGTVTPSGASILDIQDDSGNIDTNCYTSGDDLVCEYSGSD